MGAYGLGCDTSKQAMLRQALRLSEGLCCRPQKRPRAAPLHRAAYAVAAPAGPAEPMAAGQPPMATVPARRAGVTDGEWDRNDMLAVTEALKDADKLARLEAKYGGGGEL